MISAFAPWRVICALALLTPVIAVYVPLFIAPLVGLSAVLVGIHAAWSREFRIWPLPVIALSLGGFALVAVISMAWTYDPGVANGNLAKFLATLISGAVIAGAARSVTERQRSTVSRYLKIGIALALLALALELLTDGIVTSFFKPPPDRTAFLNTFNRGLAIVALMIWPALYSWTRRHWGMGLATLVAVFCFLLNFLSEAALVSIGCGIIVFALVFRFPRRMGGALSFFAAFVFLSMPAVIDTLPPPKEISKQLQLPGSSFHRLVIWKFTTENIEQRPLFGWGFDASRVIPGNKALIEGEVALPLHPHNGVLQIWLELGALGAIVAAVLAACIAEAIRRNSADRVGQATASATFVATLVIFIVSFGAWQSWWMAAISIVAACTATVTGRPVLGPKQYSESTLSAR